MTFSIDRIKYEFADSAFPMTNAQAAIYAALAMRVNDGQTQIASSTLVEQFNFKSVLPLKCRLEHLVDRGKLKVI